MSKYHFVFLLGICIWLSWSCRPANDSAKLAEVDETILTQADLDRTGGKQLRDLRQQLYQLERQKLDEYIGATLLTKEAKVRNLSVATLVEQEIDKKVPAITDDDIEHFYNSQKDRLKVELSKVSESIRAYLRKQKLEKQKAEYLSALRAKAKITTYLKPPPVYRATVKIADAATRGAETAVVTIVKFEDFQCPYCKSVQPRFTELLKKYDGKLRLIHKDLPLEELHPQARQAAEAARCAADQGKFWEYHDKLYERSPKASADDLKLYAKEIGLNSEVFEQCFGSGKHRAAVQLDLNEGAALGLTGTPSFYINGRELTGAQPLEAFTAIIDEELALAK